MVSQKGNKICQRKRNEDEIAESSQTLLILGKSEKSKGIRENQEKSERIRSEARAASGPETLKTQRKINGFGLNCSKNLVIYNILRYQKHKTCENTMFL